MKHGQTAAIISSSVTQRPTLPARNTYAVHFLGLQAVIFIYLLIWNWADNCHWHIIVKKKSIKTHYKWKLTTVFSEQQRFLADSYIAMNAYRDVCATGVHVGGRYKWRQNQQLMKYERNVAPLKFTSVWRPLTRWRLLGDWSLPTLKSESKDIQKSIMCGCAFFTQAHDDTVKFQTKRTMATTIHCVCELARRYRLCKKCCLLFLIR